MKKLQLKHNEVGWTTMEFLMTFPLLFAAFLLVIYFGLLVKTKLALTNASHSAVQALAKTRDCGKALEYLNANFDKTGAYFTTCSASDEKSEIVAEYKYAGTSILFIPVPETLLKAKAVAMTEKE